MLTRFTMFSWIQNYILRTADAMSMINPDFTFEMMLNMPQTNTKCKNKKMQFLWRANGACSLDLSTNASNRHKRQLTKHILLRH